MPPTSGVPKKKVDGFSEIGTSGLDRTNGWINEEFLRELGDLDRFVKVITEMTDNDHTVGSFLFAIDMFLRKVQWDIVPFDDTEQNDLDDAQFLRECMEDMSHSWQDFISETLTMIPFGWSTAEIVYKKRQGSQKESSKVPSSKYDDGKIGWRKFAARSQDTVDRWEFDESGGLRGWVQKAPPEYEEVPIPIEKALLFRTVVRKGNPQGRSMLRNAYRAWKYKVRFEEVEGVGIERDLAGLPVAWVDAEYMMKSATPEQKAFVSELKQIVVNVRRDEQEGLILPLMYDENNNKLFDFELMSSSGARSIDVGSVIERLNKYIAMTVLADFIMLGQDSVGSYALSTDKTGMFQAALECFLDSIENVLNMYAVPRLWEVNGLDQARMPKFKHAKVQEPNLEQLGGFITAITGAGAPMFPDPDVENVLRKRAGLPERKVQANDAKEPEDELESTRSDYGLRTRSSGGEPKEEGNTETGDSGTEVEAEA